MKKSYVVIGMGRFGSSVAERLYELGNEVLAIDTDPDKVQRMESKVTCAVVADARDEEVLRSLGARSCDCAVVAIGSDLATCIIATLNLKDLGVPQVICKATDELRKDAARAQHSRKAGREYHRHPPRRKDRGRPGRGLCAEGKHGACRSRHKRQAGKAQAMKQEHITSRQNPLLVHIRKLASSRSYRKTCGEFVAEGTKLLEEAAKWWPDLRTVVCRESVTLCNLPDTVRVVTVPEDVLKSVSTVDTPQGAIFVCGLPQKAKAELTPGTLLLDGIQDPGNLGTMLRTADALGVPVALLDGCADPYSFKTVRASMGAVFRMAVPQITEEEALAQCREKKLMLTVTALNDQAVDIRSADLTNAVAVIGSEGQGVRKSILDAAEQSVIIPMQPHCESLNAAIAAAIVMWQMKNG